jgi:rhodanese-related sulfurtransferase
MNLAASTSALRTPTWEERAGLAEGQAPRSLSTKQIDLNRLRRCRPLWVAVIGAALAGDCDTPLLQLCRDGRAAAAAARELARAGYVKVRPVAGGSEGAPAGDGRRRGGWKATVPWPVQVAPELLFGGADRHLDLQRVLGAASSCAIRGPPATAQLPSCERAAQRTISIGVVLCDSTVCATEPSSLRRSRPRSPAPMTIRS